MKHVVNGTPVVLGGALVIPAGLMRRCRGEEPADSTAAAVAADAATRARTEPSTVDVPRKKDSAFQ